MTDADTATLYVLKSNRSGSHRIKHFTDDLRLSIGLSNKIVTVVAVKYLCRKIQVAFGSFAGIFG